ncbi:MAG TPA: tetratricopeptide repeat protein [Vicinamibacteria bacterium]|nr:tetratricopeptide repeat protein [Vicinamibacteria bacterium]
MREPSTPAPREAPTPRPRTLVLGIYALAVTVALGAWLLRRPTAPPGRVAGSATPPTLPIAPPESLPAAITLPPPPSTPVPLPPQVAEVPAGGLSPEDYLATKQLVEELQAREPMDAARIQVAESLSNRNPGEAPLKALLEMVLIKIASQERAHRRYGEALADLRRAIAARPESPDARAFLVDVLLEMSDWSGAEGASRDFLVVKPRDPDGLRKLGYALMRQDRNREAAEALRASLEIREDAQARSLLDYLQKGMADERGMTEQRLARFNVRYDGDAHEDVGREILRQLEHHFATLSVTLDYQPTATIPVILFSQESYYDAAGAPAWSGGAYNHLDGRIRIPIRGLTSSLTPDMDNTLIHELTHAFIADRSRGVAPSPIHEGLAQYMEGKRVGSMLTPAQATALADGRIQGVAGFYLSALSFMEYLEAQRGQGGVNDLLRAMGETGDVNEAFRRVYGQTYEATQRAWVSRLRQEHGS